VVISSPAANFPAKRSIRIGCLPAARPRGQRTTDFGKRVAVKEEKWRPPVTGFEKLKRLQQAQLGRAAAFPFFFNRRVSFRVKASLRTASFAESGEAGGRSIATADGSVVKSNP
jgi:hypothetical protein